MAGLQIVIVGPPGEDRDTVARIIHNALLMAREGGVRAALLAEVFDEEQAPKGGHHYA